MLFTILPGDPSQGYSPVHCACPDFLYIFLFWLRAEGDEWQGLWEKGVFKKWNRSDLLPNDRVFTSRYVYKIKRSAKTGEAYRFKARMIVRGFEMEESVE